MCRLYHSPAGDYVRLCYRHGTQRGATILLPPGTSHTGGCWLRSGGSKGHKNTRRRCVCGTWMSRVDVETEQEVCSLCRSNAGMFYDALDAARAALAGREGAQ